MEAAHSPCTALVPLASPALVWQEKGLKVELLMSCGQSGTMMSF